MEVKMEVKMELIMELIMKTLGSIQPGECFTKTKIDFKLNLTMAGLSYY